MLPCDQRGSGEAVILLHAGVADRTMWDRQLDVVAALGLRAIAVDLPGFGDAPVAKARDAPWEQARAYARGREAEAAGGGPAPEAPDPLDTGLSTLAGLTCPILVCAGEHDLPDFRAAADRFAAGLPGARRAVITGAGHLAPLEAPDAFAALLRTFLGGRRGVS